MKRLFLILLFLYPILLSAQNELKKTNWLLGETGLLIPMSEYSVIVCTKCSDLNEIQTEGRSILSFEDFLFVSTYHPAAQKEDLLSSFRYELLPEKNQLHIQFELNRSNYYNIEISGDELRLVLIQ